MYQQCKDKGVLIPMIKRIADNSWIPMVEDNTDYQQYLKWLDEGNTPLPADEGVN